MSNIGWNGDSLQGHRMKLLMGKKIAAGIEIAIARFQPLVF